MISVIQSHPDNTKPPVLENNNKFHKFSGLLDEHLFTRCLAFYSSCADHMLRFLKEAIIIIILVQSVTNIFECSNIFDPNIYTDSRYSLKNTLSKKQYI